MDFAKPIFVCRYAKKTEKNAMLWAGSDGQRGASHRAVAILLVNAVSGRTRATQLRACDLVQR